MPRSGTIATLAAQLVRAEAGFPTVDAAQAVRVAVIEAVRHIDEAGGVAD